MTNITNPLVKGKELRYNRTMTFQENLQAIQTAEQLRSHDYSVTEVVQTLVDEHFSVSSIINAIAVEFNTFIFRMNDQLIVTSLQVDSELARRHEREVSVALADNADDEISFDALLTIIGDLAVIRELAALADNTVVLLHQ